MRTPATHGFTLVEALVAMTILAVGIVGVLSAYSMASRSGGGAGRLAAAAGLADRQLQLAVAQGEGRMTPQGAWGSYRWEAKFSQIRHGVWLARVAVRWTEDGGDRDFELSELFLPPREP